MKKMIIFSIIIMLMIPSITVNASTNNPPKKPTIEGSSSGKAGISYNYTFCSSDPDEDNVSYCIDWGEGTGEVCIGPYPSGTCIKQSHIYSKDGTYLIKAKAIDINQGESEYATLSVKMQKSKSILNINQGEFTAEIGVGDEVESKVFLEGNYRSRNRFIVVYGIATNGEQEVRFQGLFRGNHFLLQIPLRGRIINILGRYNIDENKKFSGTWTIRNAEISGWIKGIIR